MRIYLLFPSLILCVAAFFAVAVNAQRNDGDQPSPFNMLDGRRFVGEFVPSGKTSGRPDEFIFTGGLFHSRECLSFGFTPGPYWVRTENGRVHFFARLTSEENGVMTYEGSIAGTELNAQIEWIKPRWYWTMKRDFTFQGISGSGTTASGK